MAYAPAGLLTPENANYANKLNAAGTRANNRALSTQTDLARESFDLKKGQTQRGNRIQDQLLTLLNIDGGGPFSEGGFLNPVLNLGQSAVDTVGGAAGGGGGAGLLGGGQQLSGVPGYLQNATNQQLGMLDNYGDSMRNKLGNDFDNSLGSALGQLESRGLGSSNLRSSTHSANAEAKAQSTLALEDQVLGRKIDTLGGGASNVANAINADQNRSVQLLNGLLGGLGGMF